MRPLVAIFAHPDDESFCAGGKLALESKKRDIYLICITDGSSGMNDTHSKKELSQIRKNELNESAKILGIKKVFFLNYTDGCLCNSLYHEIASKIEEIIDGINAETIITFEPHGISGHIDHITVSMISSFVFHKNKNLKQLFYCCVDEKEQLMAGKDYFIFFPEGYKKAEIDLTVDITSVWRKKINAIQAHKSQKHDIDRMLEVFEKLPKEEHFLVRNK